MCVENNFFFFFNKTFLKIIEKCEFDSFAQKLHSIEVKQILLFINFPTEGNST